MSIIKPTLTAALLLAAFAAQAESFGNRHTMTIDGHELRIAENSARILGNEKGDAPLLVDDITDGLGKKTPGYKIQLIGRTSSVAIEAKAPREGESKWTDDRYVHRGTKVLLGIPVAKGRPVLEQAQILAIGIISDETKLNDFKPEDKIRPRGVKLTKADAELTHPYVRISALELPNMAKGEKSGGGVKYEAGVEVNGKPVRIVADSAFELFETAKPDVPKGFTADKRLVH